MHEPPTRHSWKRLVAYGLTVVAILLVGFSIGGFMYAPAGEPTGLPTDELESDLGLELNAPSAEEFDPLEPTPVAAEVPAVPVQPETVVVYISGAVAAPNTYEIEANARIHDVVDLAGGLTQDADRDHINLSERIHDAQHIHIVRLGEATTAASGDSQAVEANDGLINLNTASASELERLPGIGKVLAQRIVDWRTTNGPFASPDDLQQVKGVTASIYDEIKNTVTVP